MKVFRRRQEDCFSVCNGSALFGDLFRVSRSVERDLLSLLSIYPRILLRVFILYHLLLWFIISTLWPYGVQICTEDH